MAALAVKNNQKIDEVSVRDVQNAILDAKGYLLPYLDVPVTDVKFASSTDWLYRYIKRRREERGLV